MLATKGFVQSGLDIETIISSAYASFGSGGRILLGSSCKLQLYIFSWAFVPVRRAMNSLPSQILNVVCHKTRPYKLFSIS